MIIDGVSYEDDDLTAMRYELAQRLRARFVAASVGTPTCMFVQSLASGRYDACRQDAERGKVTPGQAREVLAEAVRYRLLTAEQTARLEVGWGVTKIELEELCG